MNRKHYCPACKGFLYKLKRYKRIMMDMPVPFFRLMCIDCGRVWDYNRFFKEYKLFEGPLIDERRLNAEDEQIQN